MQLRYVESSALLAALIEGNADAKESIRSRDRRITSMLTVTEAHRAVLRARTSERLTNDEQNRANEGLRTFARRSELAAVTDEILNRAGRSFPVEPVRTLDAIHLAMVELLGEPAHLVTVVTRDTRVA